MLDPHCCADFCLVVVKVKVTQLSLDYTVHGILQTRTLEWAAFPFSRGSSRPRDRTQVPRAAGGSFTNQAMGKPHCGECGCSLAGHGLLTAVTLSLRLPDSRAQARQLWHMGCFPRACGVFPGQIDPESPGLTGRCFTAGPPQKPS